MEISINPDKEVYDRVTKAVQDNGGYCPCKLEKTEKNKCICEEFLNSEEIGLCHCGRYMKVSL